MSNVVNLRIDFDSLRKGTWIEAQEIERHTGVLRTDKHYSLHVMQLKDEIESHCEIIGRQEGDRLWLMDDPEASLWLARQCNRGGRIVMRAGERTKLIDHSRMSKQQREQADHAERYALAMAHAVRDEKRKHRKNPAASLEE